MPPLQGAGEHPEHMRHAPTQDIVQRETADDAAATRFYDFQAGNEAQGNRPIPEFGAGKRYLGPQLQAGCFAQGVEYGFMGRNLGSLGHGRLHLTKGWVVGAEQAAFWCHVRCARRRKCADGGRGMRWGSAKRD